MNVVKISGRALRTGAALLLVLFTAAAALAQKQAPPPAATPKDFRIPEPKKFTLDNGLKVTLVPYGTVPKVTIDLAVLGGNASEGANEVWLGDLTGTWMREGTTTKTATQISESAARMGGTLDIDVGANASRVFGDSLSDFGPEMVRLVADVALHPSFPEAELARLNVAVVLAIGHDAARAAMQAIEQRPDHRAGLGWFDRLLTERDDPEQPSRQGQTQLHTVNYI
jgi:hypothetical protein